MFLHITLVEPLIASQQLALSFREEMADLNCHLASLQDKQYGTAMYIHFRQVSINLNLQRFQLLHPNHTIQQINPTQKLKIPIWQLLLLASKYNSELSLLLVTSASRFTTDVMPPRILYSIEKYMSDFFSDSNSISTFVVSNIASKENAGTDIYLEDKKYIIKCKSSASLHHKL